MLVDGPVYVEFIMLHYATVCYITGTVRCRSKDIVLRDADVTLT